MVENNIFKIKPKKLSEDNQSYIVHYSELNGFNVVLVLYNYKLNHSIVTSLFGCGNAQRSFLHINAVIVLIVKLHYY
jgi:hypothetical protein